MFSMCFSVWFIIFFMEVGCWQKLGRGGKIMLFILVMDVMLCRWVRLNGVLCIISMSWWCFLSIMFVVWVMRLLDRLCVMVVRVFIEQGVIIMLVEVNELLVMQVLMLCMLCIILVSVFIFLCCMFSFWCRLSIFVLEIIRCVFIWLCLCRCFSSCMLQMVLVVLVIVMIRCWCGWLEELFMGQ